jgi:hypothetical protein
MRFVFIVFISVLPTFAGVVNCTANSSKNRTELQSALRKGGVVKINGPCNIAPGVISMTVNGTQLLAGTNAILTATSNGNSVLNFAAAHLTVRGIDFEGFLWNADNPLSDITLLNNTLANTTGGSFSGGGGFASNGFHNSLIAHNTFHNLFQAGYTRWDDPKTNPGDQVGPACWQDYQGIDATVITNNSFSQCANDAFHITPHGSIHSVNASEFSYNQCTETHRACFELQAFASNLTIKGNVAIDFNGKFWNSFAYSIASIGSNFTFINNLGSLNTPGCAAGLPDYLEIFLSPGTVQGNVAQSLSAASLSCNQNAGDPGGPSWDFATDNFGDNTKSSDNTIIFQNNVMCGNSTITQLTHEDSKRARNYIDRYNYKNSSNCPVKALATSDVSVPVFVSPLRVANGGIVTWNVTQVSSLPVKWLRFFLDDALKPISTQELQEINPQFASDRKWFYHATFDTTPLAPGTHTLRAVATDVLGATNSSIVSFTRDTSTLHTRP